MSEDARLLADAWREARQAAWSEALDLMTRRERAGAPDLLRGRAAELARSGLAAGQLASLALDAVALAVEDGTGRDPSEAGLTLAASDDPARVDLRARVAALPVGPQTMTRVWAVREEAGADPHALARHAALNRRLWDHPDLPADDASRLVMLCAVEALEDALARARTQSPAPRRGGLRAAWARWRGLS